MRKLSHQDFDHMVQFFDQMVQTSWLSSIHEKIAQLIPPQQASVIDIGCGTGRLLQRIAQDIGQGVGVDISPEMIKEAQKQAQESGLMQRLDFLVGDAYELPFVAESFDVAVSTCVMFLLPEPEKGIAEMNRVLKKQGVLLMLNPAPGMDRGAALNFAQQYQLAEDETEYLLKWSDVAVRKHCYSPAQLKQLLTQRQFTEIQIVEVLDGLAHITRALKQ